ncbi:hypothetical protein AAC387_Pa02g0593 [Persea americana]
MAGKENKPVNEEMKIPVLTVLKKGNILKNIILHSPTSNPESDLLQKCGIDGEKCGLEGEKLLVGRHPDCDFVLDHPSISRFHLRICLQPLLQKFSVIDLSSVHGTWVSEQKIEPQVPVELKEGDTLRLGASTRMYRLQWVSFSHVFEVENPINSSAPIPEEKEEAYQDENFVPSDKKQDDLSAMQIPSAPPMLEWVSPSDPFEVQSVSENIPAEKETPELQEASPSFHNSHLERENQSPPKRKLEEKDSLPDAFHTEESVSSLMPLGVLLASDAQLEVENCSLEARFTTEVLSVSENIPVKKENPGLQEASSFIPPSHLERENQSPPKRKLEEKDSLPDVFLTEESVSSSMPSGVLLASDAQLEVENCSLEARFTTEVLSVSENTPVKKENPELQEASSSFPLSHLERENQSPPKRKLEEKDSLPDPSHTQESASSSMPLGVLLASDAQLEVEHCSLEARFTTEVPSERENRSPLRRSDSVSFLYAHTRREGCSDARIEAENQKGNMHVEQDKGEEENQKNVLGSFSASHAAESVSSSIPFRVLSASDAQLEIEHCRLEACLATEVQFEEENQSLPPINSGLRDMSNIWSRRGKSADLIQLHTGRKVTSHAGIKADKQKEIMYVEQDKREEDTFCKALFFGADEEEEPIPSDKENMTPQGHPNLKLEKGKPKIKEPELLKSSLEVIDADSYIEDNVFSADKENRMPKLSYEMKSKKQTSENQKRIRSDMMVKRRAERVPFQSLLENSSNGKSVSVPNASTSRNSHSVNYTHIMKEINSSSSNQSVDQAVLKAGQSKRKWYMVADTSCLLNEESRRSLKLLEGIKGIQLLIPRMVIRELDCLRRRGSWFKKENEASSILQWIEECMTKMRWWIHVQSSTEGMPVAPTPPASPRSRLSEGSNEFGTATSVPFSTCGSLMEIVSPTAEDHILECALFFKRIKNDGRLVLLTNDTALKIKAMAEGLICESAKEFRDSLVNPYSERFLWVESTPIGPTWSCVEGTGKKENYNYCPPLKKTVKAAEGAKGLKLILLHNSHYGQIDPVK